MPMLLPDFRAAPRARSLSKHSPIGEARQLLEPANALYFQFVAGGARPASPLSRGVACKMLRIQRLDNREVALVLSGRLDLEHVADLDTLIRAETSGRKILLDLKDMTLAGQEGIDFLAQCEAAGIGLVNCAPYVREWITR